MRFAKIIFFLLSIATAGSWSQASLAQAQGFYIATQQPHTQAQRKQQSNVARSSGEAASIAKQRYGGEVLKVQLQGEGRDRKYKVRLLLDNGRVKEVTIKAG